MLSIWRYLIIIILVESDLTEWHRCVEERSLSCVGRHMPQHLRFFVRPCQQYIGWVCSVGGRTQQERQVCGHNRWCRLVPFVNWTSSVWGWAGTDLGHGGRTMDGGSQQEATLNEVPASALVGRCSARKRCVYFVNFAGQWQLEVGIDNNFNYIDIVWCLI